MELPKIPSVVGCKNLQKTEGIPMVEEVKCKLVELLGAVGSKGKSSMVVDVKLVSSLIYSQCGDCCESDSKLEKLKFARKSKSGLEWCSPGPKFCMFLETFDLTFFGARMVKVGPRIVITVLK